MITNLFDIFRRSLSEIWADLWTNVICAILWVAALVLIIPAPPVTLGLFYYANRRAHGEVADLKDFWFGIRHYWKTAYAWAGINLVIAAFLTWDYRLTGQLGSASGYHLLQGLYLTMAVVWGFLQLYSLPFLFEQAEPSLRQAFRNGAVMLGRNPLFSAGLFLALVILLSAGMLLFMVTIVAGGSLLAFVGNYAVLNRLAAGENLAA